MEGGGFGRVEGLRGVSGVKVDVERVGMYC